jgi:hypothetical protein
MHYNIDVDTDRKIAVAKIYGIWKAALALEYHNEYKRLVDPLLGRGWAKLTNLTNWKSSYPEIVEIIGRHMRWCFENGAVCSVYVIENPTTRNQLNRMIQSGIAKDYSKVFRTVTEADNYLHSRGF